MIRKSDLIWLGIATVAGSTLFHTSYRVQDLRERLAQVQQNIARERTAISVLNAEWSYLNGPERLEQQAAAHLKLKPLTAQQVAGLETVAALPPRPQPPHIVPAVLTSPPGPQAAAQAPRPVGRAPQVAPPARPPEAPPPILGQQRSAPLAVVPATEGPSAPALAAAAPAATGAGGAAPVGTVAAAFSASLPAATGGGASAASTPAVVRAVARSAPAAPPSPSAAGALARAAHRSARAIPAAGFAAAAAPRPAAPAYIPATDEIGQLLARLGRAR